MMFRLERTLRTIFLLAIISPAYWLKTANDTNDLSVPTSLTSLALVSTPPPALTSEPDSALSSTLRPLLPASPRPILDNAFFLSKSNDDHYEGTEMTGSSTPFDENYLKGQCIYADICDRNGKALPNKSKRSCCVSCSCDPFCEVLGNCCNNNITDVSPMCHSSVLENESFEVETEAFLMVDRCLNDSNTAECKAVSTEPWGSLYPVYDAVGDRIFYNQHCAECSGVYLYTHWDITVSCVTDYFSNKLFQRALQGKNCSIGFIPPADLEITKHVCHKDLVSHCNVTGYWRKYDEQLDMACRRWYSPIVGGDIAFSNVFCKLCNGFDNDPEALCDAPSPYFGYHFFIEPFTMLINRTMVSDFLNSWTDVEIYKWDGKCGKAMVKHPFKDECRPVLCPEGYIRKEEGCVLVSTAWMKQRYFIQLEMTPASGSWLPWSYLTELSNEQRNDTGVWFDAKGAPLDYFELFAENVTIGQIPRVKKLIVRLGRKLPQINVDKETKVIQNAMGKPWEINLRGNTYIYTVKFDKFATYVRDGISVRYHTLEAIKNNHYVFEEQPEERMYTSVGFQNYEPPDFVLRKMNFCEKVRLLHTEWAPLYQEIIFSPNVTHKCTDRILGDSEFDAGFDEDLDEVTIEICVDDFNPNYYSNLTSGILPRADYTRSLRIFMFLIIWGIQTSSKRIFIT